MKEYPHLVVRTKGINNGIDGLRKYIEFINDPQKCGKAKSLIPITGDAEMFIGAQLDRLNKFNAARLVENKGGRPVTTLAQVFTVYMPPEAPPSRNQWVVIARDAIAAANRAMEPSVEVKTYGDAYIVARNGVVPSLTILIGKLSAGLELRTDLARKSVLYAIKSQSFILRE